MDFQKPPPRPRVETFATALRRNCGMTRVLGWLVTSGFEGNNNLQIVGKLMLSGQIFKMSNSGQVAAKIYQDMPRLNLVPKKSRR